MSIQDYEPLSLWIESGWSSISSMKQISDRNTHPYSQYEVKPWESEFLYPRKVGHSGGIVHVIIRLLSGDILEPLYIRNIVESFTCLGDEAMIWHIRDHSLEDPISDNGPFFLRWCGIIAKRKILFPHIEPWSFREEWLNLWKESRDHMRGSIFLAESMRKCINISGNISKECEIRVLPSPLSWEKLRKIFLNFWFHFRHPEYIDQDTITKMCSNFWDSFGVIFYTVMECNQHLHRRSIIFLSKIILLQAIES